MRLSILASILAIAGLVVACVPTDTVKNHVSAGVETQIDLTNQDSTYIGEKACLECHKNAGDHASMGVHVSALCPGFTSSEFHDVNGTRATVSTMPKWMWQSAEAVVEEGLRAVEANEPVHVSGFANRRLAWLNKALPDSMSRAIVAGQSKRFRRME